MSGKTRNYRISRKGNNTEEEKKLNQTRGKLRSGKETIIGGKTTTVDRRTGGNTCEGKGNTISREREENQQRTGGNRMNGREHW